MAAPAAHCARSRRTAKAGATSSAPSRNCGRFAAANCCCSRCRTPSGRSTPSCSTTSSASRTSSRPGSSCASKRAARPFRARRSSWSSHIRRVNPPQDRLQGFREEDCVLSSPRSADEMWAELIAHLRIVRDPHIRVLLNRITADHERELREWPAAQQIHHAYRGGLLEHTLKMAEIARVARAGVRRQRRPRASPACCCTTSASCRNCSYEPGAISYTRDGNLIGHIAPGPDPRARGDQRRSPAFPTTCARRSNIWCVASRLARARLAGRAEDDRGLHPRRRRRARLAHRSGAARDPRRRRRRASSRPGIGGWAGCSIRAGRAGGHAPELRRLLLLALSAHAPSAASSARSRSHRRPAPTPRRSRSENGSDRNSVPSTTAMTGLTYA